jgi:outer membrane protein assembly factor BamA
MNHHLAVGYLLLACVSILRAQDPDTRSGLIEAARAEKIKKLSAEEPDKVEKAFLYVADKKLLERFAAGVAGVRVKLGGLATGSGFALGPEYLRRDLMRGGVVVRGSARTSTKRWQLYDLQLTLPKLLDDHALVDVTAVHRNFAGINYYGPGPGSRKTGRSDFRLEDTSYNGKAMLRPFAHLWFGGQFGYLDVNVGPGADKRFVSAERIYTPAQAAGIDRQSAFLNGALIAEWDSRDNAGGPRRGSLASARYSLFSDRDFGAYSFRRLDLEAQQYLPFFNEKRVIALRAKTSSTSTNAGQRVPFYLQPVLGGSDDLRGFRPFRFYDNNLMVFNAEYRWETFTGLDMSVFGDAGKVFARDDQWNLKKLEGSAGFGFRFNVRNAVFMRVDVGFSREGYQVWLKFNNVF